MKSTTEMTDREMLEILIETQREIIDCYKQDERTAKYTFNRCVELYENDCTYEDAVVNYFRAWMDACRKTRTKREELAHFEAELEKYKSND